MEVCFQAGEIAPRRGSGVLRQPDVRPVLPQRVIRTVRVEPVSRRAASVAVTVTR